jgi:hypothetical protein
VNFDGSKTRPLWCAAVGRKAKKEIAVLYVMSTKRRTFLQQVAFAGAATQSSAPAQSAAPAQTAPPTAPDIAYPRVFTGRRLTAIAFPLGGVGSGAISLGGRGQLRDWEIFNRPDKGNAPNYAFPAIWVQSGAGKSPSPACSNRASSRPTKAPPDSAQRTPPGLSASPPPPSPASSLSPTSISPTPPSPSASLSK